MASPFRENREKSSGQVCRRFGLTGAAEHGILFSIPLFSGIFRLFK
jgi:hypothetical protein